jgi:hypothetical protein
VDPAARTFYNTNKDIFSPPGKQQLTEVVKGLNAPCVPVFGNFLISFFGFFLPRKTTIDGSREGIECSLRVRVW